jgi:preprotein translocase subunit Sss1
MIDAIENSAYAVWVRESPSIFAYTSILSLHAIGLAIIVGINYLIALRMLGFVPGIPLPALRKLFPWMYLGFTINLFSGTSLFVANLSNDLGNWLFICKLIFILFAMINLELTKTQVFDRPGTVGVDGLPKNAKLFAWGAFILWGLAMVAGRFTAYPNFVEAWLGF